MSAKEKGVPKDARSQKLGKTEPMPRVQNRKLDQEKQSYGNFYA